MCSDHIAGWSSSAARWAHNPKVVGSNPTPATNIDSLYHTHLLGCVILNKLLAFALCNQTSASPIKTSFLWRRSLVGYSGRFIPDRSMVRIHSPLPHFYHHGPMVKRLRHHPFTVVTGVRFPLGSPEYKIRELVWLSLFFD